MTTAVVDAIRAIHKTRPTQPVRRFSKLDRFPVGAVVAGFQQLAQKAATEKERQEVVAEFVAWQHETEAYLLSVKRDAPTRTPEALREKISHAKTEAEIVSIVKAWESRRR